MESLGATIGADCGFGCAPIMQIRHVDWNGLAGSETAIGKFPDESSKLMVWVRSGHFRPAPRVRFGGGKRRGRARASSHCVRPTNCAPPPPVPPPTPCPRPLSPRPLAPRPLRFPARAGRNPQQLVVLAHRAAQQPAQRAVLPAAGVVGARGPRVRAVALERVRLALWGRGKAKIPLPTS